jgi:ferrous iron transport protein A
MFGQGRGQRQGRGRGHGWGAGHDGQGEPGRGWRSARREDDATLASLRPGRSAVIGAIDDDRARAQAYRFGMGQGARVRCMNVLPAGPIVIRSGRQEIAVGRGLARRIGITSAGEA